jgi:hypothetical protein
MRTLFANRERTDRDFRIVWFCQSYRSRIMNDGGVVLLANAAHAGACRRYVQTRADGLAVYNNNKTEALDGHLSEY